MNQTESCDAGLKTGAPGPATLPVDSDLATKADIADLRTAISEAKLHIILAVVAIAGVLFAALRLT